MLANRLRTILVLAIDETRFRCVINSQVDAAVWIIPASDRVKVRGDLGQFHYNAVIGQYVAETLNSAIGLGKLSSSGVKRAGGMALSNALTWSSVRNSVRAAPTL